jgi:hypothetical protein
MGQVEDRFPEIVPYALQAFAAIAAPHNESGRFY